MIFDLTKNRIKLTALTVAFILMAAMSSPNARADGSLAHLVITQLQSRFTDARIVLNQTVDEEAESANLQSLDGKGVAVFRVEKDGKVVLRNIRFSAWTQVLVAERRISPKERIVPEMVRLEDVDLATGQNYINRGLLMSSQAKLSKVEAKLTLIEGQPILLSAVAPVPDLRLGQNVQVKLLSSGLSLTTNGRVDQDAFANEPVRVTVQTTKKQLTGRLSKEGNVEVTL